MASQESLARVQELYVAYYGRPADQEGQEYWADRLEDEGESAIIDSFGNSAEYDELSEGQGNATLVDNLYQQMFGRHADPEGLTYYTGVLESGEKSLAEIATTILNAASGVDQNDFNAKVEAAAEYTAEFGAAADYDTVAAQDVVENAEGGLYTPELTPAIEDYQGAQEAVSDYLQDTVASNEAVADALETAGNADDPTDDQVTSALGTALDTAVDGVESNADDIGTDELSDNASVAAAQIEAQQEAYADAVESAEATVAETDGLQGAINSLQSAETRYESALKAEIETSTAQDAELAKFASLNDGAANDYTVADDGTITDSDGSDVVVADGDTLVAADDYADSDGIDALVSASQAQYDATAAVTKQYEAATDAGNKVAELDDTTESVSVDADSGVTFTAATDGSDAESLINAQTAVENFDEAVADYQELTDLQSQVGNLETAKSDASDAIEEQGVNLVDYADNADATDGDDLFVFDADAGNVSLGTADADTEFGFAGEDQLYIGDSYTAVEVGSDEALDSDALGDSGVLEVFFSDDGAGNTTLSFENEAFAGSASNTSDLTQVTLTGVNADDLQLDNGYIAVA